MTTLDERAWTLRTREGVRLFVREIGDADARDVLVVVHGYGEHGGRYVERLGPFVDAGFRVVLPDMRGHGKSDGPRGHVLHFDAYAADVEQLVDHLGVSPERLHLLGHSNGGLISLLYLLTRPRSVRVAALSAPLLGFAVEAPRWKLAAGRTLSRVLPRVSLPTEIDPAHLSHDPAVRDAYANDPLNHFVVNTRWFTEAERAITLCGRQARHLPVPLLMLLAGDDRLVDAMAARRWAERAPEGLVTVEEVPGAFHELLFEVDGARHAERLLEHFSTGREA
ncbi:MAG: alpha/beta hydrolase [Deltaproteobacteria bacterium]|nr:MAG: alpha/beta hydrolase [Deltaproteobacteria bacterium]